MTQESKSYENLLQFIRKWFQKFLLILGWASQGFLLRTTQEIQFFSRSSCMQQVLRKFKTHAITLLIYMIDFFKLQLEPIKIACINEH